MNKTDLAPHHDVYASKEEMAVFWERNAKLQNTSDHQWLNAELDRIDPHRLDQGHDCTKAMVELIFRQKRELDALRGELVKLAKGGA